MNAPAKPSVRPVSSDRFYVTYRGMKVECFQSRPYRWHAACHASKAFSCVRHMTSGEGAFSNAVDEIDRVQDCERAQVLADELGSKGVDFMLNAISPAAKGIRTGIVQRAMKGDSDALVTAEAVVKYLNKKPAKRPAPVHAASERFNKASATAYPGLGVLVHAPEGDRFYAIGELGAYSGWNLTYTGTIISVGKKTVTVDDNGRRKRITHSTFAAWNERPMSSISASNSDTLNYI